MKDNKKSTGATIGVSIKNICYFLTVLFCTLRACDIIQWSWVRIMMPIFISWGISIICLIIAGIIALAAVEDM